MKLTEVHRTRTFHVDDDGAVYQLTWFTTRNFGICTCSALGECPHLIEAERMVAANPSDDTRSRLREFSREKALGASFDDAATRAFGNA